MEQPGLKQMPIRSPGNTGECLAHYAITLAPILWTLTLINSLSAFKNFLQDLYGDVVVKVATCDADILNGY